MTTNMTMRQMQNHLARMMRDAEAVAGFLYDHRHEADWLLMEHAMDDIGMVCNGFLDDHVLDNLNLSEDSDRLEPGLIGIESRCPHVFRPSDVGEAKKPIPIKTGKGKRAA